MAKPEWGVKRSCTSCGAKFYDLRRDPIICPKCDTALDPAAVGKSQRAKAPAAVKEAPTKPAKKAEMEDDDLIVAEDDSLDDDSLEDDSLEDVDIEDDDNAAIEDASELGEDKDDMFGVIDAGSDEGDETR